MKRASRAIPFLLTAILLSSPHLLAGGRRRAVAVSPPSPELSLTFLDSAGMLDAGLPAGKAVSEAKAQASLTARLAPERAHAVHAGIAFILDFDVQLFTRRCRHWELDIGDERYHRERITAALAA